MENKIVDCTAELSGEALLRKENAELRATIERMTNTVSSLRIDCAFSDKQWKAAEVLVTTLEAEKTRLVGGLEGSTAIRSSTEQGYPVAIYFIDLAHAQKFHEFLTDRCAEIRAAIRARASLSSTEKNDG